MESMTGRTFVIRNKRSNLFLNVVYYSTEPSAGIEQWPLQEGYNRDSQVWHVFALDDRSHMFVNKRSGLCLNVKYNSTVVGAPLEQYFLQHVLEATQNWRITRDSVTESNNCTVMNDRTGHYVSVESCSTLPSARIQQWPLEDSYPVVDSQLWIFELSETYDNVVEADWEILYNVLAIGSISRIESWMPPKKATTSKVLVGQMVIPFPMINDPVLEREEQSMVTPYYILNRIGYWHLVKYTDNDGQAEAIMRYPLDVGNISFNSELVEETTGICVTAENSFHFRGMSRLISRKFGQRMNVTVGGDVTAPCTRTIQIERIFPYGKRVAEAMWYRHDDYLLHRQDGTTVVTWTIRDPTRYEVDTFCG